MQAKSSIAEGGGGKGEDTASCTEQAQSVAAAYALLADKVASVYGEDLKDGLSGGMGSKDIDTIMKFVAM